MTGAYGGGPTPGRVVGMGACLLVLMLLALLLLLSACSSGATAEPPGPFEWRQVNSSLWMACTPPGDRVYAYVDNTGGSGLAVVPAGCAP